MTKLTKKVALEIAIAVLNGDSDSRFAEFSTAEVITKLSDMIQSLDSKSSDKKLTEQQKQNVGFKGDILAFLADGREYTATEILRGVPTFPPEMSNQRVSQLLRQLIIDQQVVKRDEKGKSLFKLA
jgi:hypothetical protein